ncbi:MAG TPA: alpha/beta fold hydrolase [Kofleriaceae bacterium]|nr:alpha/beta fold hydrolase [Kofleriaceae bacterium]
MKPLVVLLHGLARGHGSMAKLGAYLRRHGFETWGQTYPSRRHSIAYLASALTEQLVDVAGDRPLHAVTHSMGGIVVRHLQDPRLRWSRIVMLAPPNRGSQLAASMVRNPLFRFFYGPAALELGEASAWPMPPAPVAVIAGTRSLALSNVTSWTVGRRFPAGVKNDGTVAVDETKLAEMAAFAEVDATHTWIMNSEHVRHLVVTYLSEGRFPGVTA